MHEDIVEAPENPFDDIGVDVMVSGSYVHSARRLWPWHFKNLDLARMQVVIYHRTLAEMIVTVRGDDV